MDDLISRQSAIDELNDGAELLRRVLDDADIVGAERAKYEWGLGLIESYISDMEELPSAQPEQKHGGWIKMSDSDGIYFACSVCGEDLPRVIQRFDPQFDLFPRLESIDKTNYCPSCGADMRGEKK